MVKRIHHGGTKAQRISLCLRAFVVVLFSNSLINSAISQDSIPVKERNWSLNGYIKDMQTIVIPKVDGKWSTDNLIHNRLNFKWNISKAFIFCLGERNRFYWGDLVYTTRGYDDYIAYDNGLINMSWNIFHDSSYVLNAAIDRLWLDFTSGNLQVTIGRQRINWSQTFVWNPNDLFNTYSYFDFDYEEKPGSDAIRFQYFTTPSSRIEIAGKADKDRKITAAAFYRFNKWQYDFQGLAGIYTQSDVAFGAGWAGQILKGGFKGELTWFQPVKNFFDTTGIFLASVEYDYTFRNSLFIQFEGFYNSNKINASNIIISQLNPQLLNAKNPFLTEVSLFGNISYPITPLISASLSGIYNPDNRMYFIIPTFTFSLTNNLDLSLVGETFQSYGQTSSMKSETIAFIRLKGSF